MFENLLIENSWDKMFHLDVPKKRSILQVVVLQEPLSGKNTSTKGQVKLVGKLKEGDFFSRLKGVSGPGGLKTALVNFNFSLALGSQSFDISCDKDLRINEKESGSWMVWSSFTFPESMVAEWGKTTVLTFSGHMSVKINPSSEVIDTLRFKKVELPMRINKKVLTESLSSDAVIVAGNGVEIKCLKGFLMAHSSVFQTMFGSAMKEGITNKVELPHMSEAGVRALLDYVYCWELEEAFKMPTIALELLVAAEKYDIGTLENAMKDLMVSKTDDWITLGVAVQLFQFSKSKADVTSDSKYRKIQAKCAAIIKSKSYSELLECQEYQDLFHDPVAGMEFCGFFLTNLNLSVFNTNSTF